MITGTPGTGKSTVARLLSKKISFERVNISELVEKEKLFISWDKKHRTKIVDTDGLKVRLEEIAKKIDKDLIIDGHLAHFAPNDIVTHNIVLRAHPKELKKRLIKKGFQTEKIKENIEAEALDICLSEAVENYGREKVFEIDTTKRTAKEVMNIILRILLGKTRPGEFSPGQVDFLESVF